jgi:hypothetical protein
MIMVEYVGALAIMAAFFVLMSVRLIFIKNGQFKRKFALQRLVLQSEGATCGFCGKDMGSCDNEKKDNQREVNKLLSKF